MRAWGGWLMLMVVLAGCAEAPATPMPRPEEPFVDRFEFRVQGAGPADTCANTFSPVEGAPSVAVNRPAETMRFEFRGIPIGAPLNGDLSVELVGEDGAVLANARDPGVIVLDLTRAQLAEDARFVTIRAYACNAAYSGMDVHAAVSFFQGPVPEGYSAF